MDDPKRRAVQSAADLTLGDTNATSADFAAGVQPKLTAWLPGTVVAGRYEVVALLGEGGMGSVYKAHDRELGRLVALKTIRPELAGDAVILQRFKQEIILARQITHRNVIRIFDLGEADGVKFITMEFVEGEDLAGILRRRGSLPPNECADIMIQVCAGLEAAHAEGVLHRDLKPGNIMRDAHGRICVMDFGLARTFAEHQAGTALQLPSDANTLASSHPDYLQVTRPGAMVGTIQYMSPEQAKGEPLDARSDVYAVGLILYELLTGKTPFHAESAVATLLKRTQERAASPSSVNATIPKPLSDINLKCLQIDPAKRYQSASELLAALQTWRHPELAKARRRTLVRSIASLTLLFVLIASLATYLLRDRIFGPVAAHPPVTVLVSDFQNTTNDAVFDGTLEPAFTLALEGASFITSFNRNQARKLAAKIDPGAKGIDFKTAQLIAQREGVNVVIDGSVARAGSAYKITVTAVDSGTGKTIAARQEQANNKNDVLKVLASLAAQVRSALGDKTPQSKQIAAAETFTAASLDASQHYARAQDLGWAGKWHNAIAEYEKAIAIDPNLGRAYAGMAVAYANIGQRQQSAKYFQMALARIDRMSEREKYRTRGGYYLLTRDADKAVDEFTQLTKQFPSDTAGWANLAYAYFYRRDMANAMREGRHAIEIYPNNVPQRNNVGLYAMYGGDFDTAIREQDEVLKLNPSFTLAYVGKALSQLGQGKPADATETWDKLASLGSSNSSYAAAGLADLALYEGRDHEAVQMLRDAIATDLRDKNNDSAASKLIMLAEAQAPTSPAAAAQSAERALSFSKEDAVVTAAARVFVAVGQVKRAQALATQLGQKLASEPQMESKLIEAEIALVHNPAAAITLLKEAQKLGDSWLIHYDLGRAYLAAGAFTEADSEFETCLKRRGEATAAFLDEMPTYRYFPPVYYYLARAQEGLNSPAATDSYKTFLAMKKGGEDPLVADARRRIASH